MAPQLPPEILLHVFSFLSPASLVGVCSVCKLYSDLSSTPSLWMHAHAAKWTPSSDGLEERDKNKEDRDNEEGDRENDGKDKNVDAGDNEKGDESKGDGDGDVHEPHVQDWKMLYKTKLKAEKQLQLQKASAESLKYQSRLAVLLSRKREFDHAMQHLQNKKSKLNTSTEKENLITLVKTGWHPSDVQRHFDKKTADTKPQQGLEPPSTPSSPGAKKRSADDSASPPLEASTHQSKFLQSCLESVRKKTLFTQQILEKFMELSQETEQRKRELSLELKKFGK